MRYLHTMLRVRNLDAALKFYQDALGLKEVRRVDNDKAKFTLVFPVRRRGRRTVQGSRRDRGAPLVELTYNWDEEKYGEDRYFGHLAYEVDDIYATCDRLMKTRHHHQPSAARRSDGLRPLAGSAFDRTSAEGRCEAAGGAVGLDAEYRTLVRGFSFRLPEPDVLFRVLEFMMHSWRLTWDEEFCSGCLACLYR